MLFNRRRVNKHIGYCYLFPVISFPTAACFCTQLATVPFQNDLLQKSKVLANLGWKQNKHP